MRRRTAAWAVPVLLPLAALTSAAGNKDKTIDPGRAENAGVSVTAFAHTDPAEFPQIVGADIGPYFTVVDVTVTPRKGKYKISRDDFLLRSYRDGEHTRPLAVSEIAGSADMVVHQTNVGPSEPNGGGTGPVWVAGPVMGGGVGVVHPNVMTATVAKDKDKDKSGKHNALADLLKKKMLPEEETDRPVSGLLIFNLEKQRLKDLELEYTTPDGPLKVHFK